MVDLFKVCNRPFIKLYSGGLRNDNSLLLISLSGLPPILNRGYKITIEKGIAKPKGMQYNKIDDVRENF